MGDRKLFSLLRNATRVRNDEIGDKDVVKAIKDRLSRR